MQKVLFDSEVPVSQINVVCCKSMGTLLSILHQTSCTPDILHTRVKVYQTVFISFLSQLHVLGGVVPGGAWERDCNSAVTMRGGSVQIVMFTTNKSQLTNWRFPKIWSNLLLECPLTTVVWPPWFGYRYGGFSFTVCKRINLLWSVCICTFYLRERTKS